MTKLSPEDLLIDPELRKLHAPYLEPPVVGSRFANPWRHPPLPGLRNVLKWKLSGNPLRGPAYRTRPIAHASEGLAGFLGIDAAVRIFWIGHASFLIDVDGVGFVTDPIFGRAGGVVKRVTAPAARPEQLPELAAVLVTHGHHDHLDPKSLAALAERQGEHLVFVVPKGLGRALPRACRRIVELSWWQHVTLSGVRVHLVPAQHWHQRGPLDKNQGLWGGFVIEGSHTVYHAGDTGYFPGFAAIGRVFGGIDAACLPLGAYEPEWMMSTQHMSPKGSLAAYRDLGARHFVGMHWGTFDLSNEPLDAGPRWLFDAIAREGLPPELFHVIRPGGTVAIDRHDTQRLGAYEPGAVVAEP